MAPRDTQSVPHTAHSTHDAYLDEQPSHLAAPLRWNPPAAVYVCMYCSTVIGSEHTGAYCLLHEPAHASHGACQRCYRRFCHQLRRGVKNPLAPLVRLRRQHIFGVPYDPYQQTYSPRDGSPSGSQL